MKPVPAKGSHVFVETPRYRANGDVVDVISANVLPSRHQIDRFFNGRSELQKKARVPRIAFLKAGGTFVVIPWTEWWAFHTKVC